MYISKKASNIHIKILFNHYFGYSLPTTHQLGTLKPTCSLSLQIVLVDYSLHLD